MVYKVVRRDILPRMKFASFSKGFQEPDDRVFGEPNNPCYIILQNLECISGYSYVDHVIYWNFHHSEVEGVLS